MKFVQLKKLAFDEISNELHFYFMVILVDDKLVVLFVSIKMLMKRDESKSLAS